MRLNIDNLGGRRPRHQSGYRWVEGHGEHRTKEEWPYSYSPHYLWGDKHEGAEAVYSDRLVQWDRESVDRALASVKDLNCRYGYWGQQGTSKFLSTYFGRSVHAVAVAEGCNVSNGYPYWIFWFVEADKSNHT